MKCMGVVQVPVLAYKDEKTQQPHSVYESLICNEFLEVCLLLYNRTIRLAMATGHTHRCPIDCLLLTFGSFGMGDLSDR